MMMMVMMMIDLVVIVLIIVVWAVRMLSLMKPDGSSGNDVVMVKQ